MHAVHECEALAPRAATGLKHLSYPDYPEPSSNGLALCAPSSGKGKKTACLCGGASWLPDPAQWLKDLVLPQLWYTLHLQLGVNPWPGNFPMPGVWQKKKKTKKKKGPTACRDKAVIQTRLGFGTGLEHAGTASREMWSSYGC